MAIKIGQEFERTSKATRFKDDVMTKAQMLAGTDDNYSDGYLVVEKDSHDLYIYDSNATPSQETGKFVKKETGSGGSSDYSNLTNKPKINSIELNGDKKAEDLEIKTFGRYENEDVYGIHTYTDFFGFKSDKSIQGYGSWGFAYDSSVKDVVMINSEYEPADNHQIQRRLPTREAVNTLLANKQDTLQVTTLPTASATEEGNIYQYVGQTDSNYTNGYFYQCQEVTPATDPKTYEWVQKDVQSSELPAGGTTGQILAKNSDDDGDAGWIVDTGKDLNKLVQWGTNNSQSPRTEYVPEITDSTTDPYHRVILHIPIQGSALQGIEATEESLKNCLKTRFKIRYNTDLNGTVVFTTTTEDTAGDLPNSFGMKTNLTSGYADSRLDIYLNETTISNNTLHLAVNYYVKFSASQTNHHGKPQNVVLLANDGYTFGITPVGEPYYVHNSTKIALDDLQINNLNIPTSWGVAKTGNLKMYMTNKQSYQYLWFGNLGFSSVDDYVIFVDITGGMEAAWGKPTVIVSNKSATEAGISLECDSAEATWFNVNYVIIGKGYGNITSSGGGSLPTGGTTGQALVKKSNTDGDVEWKTVGGESTIDKIEVNGVEQPIVNKTVDIEVPEVSMQSYDNMSITPAGASSGFVFNANTDNVTVTTETGTRTLPTKTYVDSKSPTIVNEGATFTNAAGNQQMQIRTGGANSVIIKDLSANGLSEYWSYELPAKPYVDTEVAKRNAVVNFDNEYKTLQIRDVDNNLDLQIVKETSNDYIRVNEYAEDDRGQMQQIFDVNLPTKTYVDTLTGDLSTLTTTDTSSLVNAINEVYEKSGEPFRVKNWASSWSAGVSIDPCTTDKTNANLSKMTYSIDAVEGADYQIVGMIAYEVFDNTSGGNRLNVWPVCQFTGNGQKELSVRWVCAGTTVKTAKRINAWVLLKHR